MCYLARQHQAPLEDESAAGSTTHTPGIRPRWVGGAIAAVIGGFALAAFLTPGVQQPASADQASAGPQQVVANEVPTTPVAERSSLSPDDGVPTTDVAKAGDGSCHHGL
jgi:hypothetical protein